MAMMRETVEAARRVGRDPGNSIERRLRGAEKAGGHKTSTLQHLEQGKPLELDALPAAMAEPAGPTGAQVPTLRAIHAVSDLLNENLVRAVQPGIP